MSPQTSQHPSGPPVSPIFLVGMPGCGKSTVGKVLAAQLDYTFLDLDTAIEEQEGQTVPEVFEHKGQEYFRQAEAQTLRLLANRKEKMVIATGGGAPCFHENIAFMTATGVAVYLKLSPAELVGRLTALDLQVRPLLRDKTEAELLQYLSQTLAQRELFYEQASCAVASGNRSVEAIAQEIRSCLPAPDHLKGGRV